MDNIANIPGVAPVVAVIPGANTPAAYSAPVQGLSDGNNIASASKNRAAIYNMINHELVSLIKSAGLVPDINNWAQVAQAVEKLIDDALLANVDQVGMQSVQTSLSPFSFLIGNGTNSAPLRVDLYELVSSVFATVDYATFTGCLTRLGINLAPPPAPPAPPPSPPPPPPPPPPGDGVGIN